MIYINGRFLTQRMTGSQRFAYEILTQLLYNKLNNYCVLVPPGEIQAGYNIDGWPIKTVGKLKSTIWEQVDLPIFLYRNGGHLLINLVNTAPCLYKNQIATIMDMTTFVNPKWFTRSFSTYYKLILPVIGKNSLKILTVSEHSKKDILRFINIAPAKVEVIYCAVSKNFMAAAKAFSQQEDILKKIGIKKNAYILGVSSLDPRKNFDTLIRAYLQMNTDLPLIIVGSSGKAFASSALEHLAAEQVNIKFTGYVSDEELISLYKFASCFVYPSLYEGFGLPPLEAMACGCPTIVSNSSSIPEVCGDASIYVEPTDVDNLNTAISDLLSNQSKRENLIELGYAREKKFSWVASCKRLEVIIHELVQ